MPRGDSDSGVRLSEASATNRARQNWAIAGDELIPGVDRGHFPAGDRDPQLGITKAGNIYLRLFWSSAPTMSSVRVEGLDVTTVGLHLASREGKQSTIVPSLPLLASWQYCFIASGLRKSHTSRSTR
jgi:hypothetical protein